MYIYINNNVLVRKFWSWNILYIGCETSGCTSINKHFKLVEDPVLFAESQFLSLTILSGLENHRNQWPMLVDKDSQLDYLNPQYDG